MARFLSLDIGNVWTGIAQTDILNILVSPLNTIKTLDLNDFIKNKLINDNISKIIIGYPITMHGKDSQQTKFTIDIKDSLKASFPDIEFILWDERLSSYRANTLAKKNNFKANKLSNHSRAAAFILDSYLQYLKGL
jgi:putative Holliday junction resolvase